ncbi:MAG: hypothetical protein LKF76_00965 [Eggerthellaceae bacterium]|jgi:lysozyme|nr:hypothetical protein [Eggerthellaceae bacterium]
MALNGLDISAFQGGIDLSAVPADFVIIKATQGNNYVNPSCNDQWDSANGKLRGLYHYADGGDAIEEADYFLDNIAGYIGQAVLFLDWEDDAVSCGVDWAKTWLDHVRERTGIAPLIYMSNSVVNGYDWSPVSCDYGLWNAGYYAGYDRMGYQDDPPLIGGTGTWDVAALYQYTSVGDLDGWNGNLDLDIFYGDSDTWNAYIGNTPQSISPQDAGDVVNDSGFYYRAHVSDYGWLDSVRDGQTAGTTGKALQLEAIKITPPDGLTLEVKAHIQDIGWKTWSGIRKGDSSGEGSSNSDPIIGTVGQSLMAEAIEVTPTENNTGKKLHYRVHLAGVGWTDWIDQGYTAGTVGINKAIEAIQFVLD